MEEHCQYSRTVQYNSASHVEVIAQIYGSVWPRVLPHCLVNTFVTIGLLVLLQNDIDLTISEFGHEFMSVIVAFLVVSRCTISFSLYYEFRGYTASMFQATRELPSLACAMTASSSSEKSQKWRNDVALYSMLLLRTTVAVLEGERAWEVPQLPKEDQERLAMAPIEDLGIFDSTEMQSIHSRDWVYGKNALSDLNLRVPVRMAQKLRRIICESNNTDLDTIQQRQLQECVNNFMTGYSGVRKYLTTPFPFPLANMARTFLFFYVYTLPFALLSTGCPPVQTVVLVFIVTYGFLGIEFVSLELDDPFGDDASDLPIADEAKNVYDDVALVLMDVDGMQVASDLRRRMRPVSTPSHSDNELGHLLIKGLA